MSTSSSRLPLLRMPKRLVTARPDFPFRLMTNGSGSMESKNIWIQPSNLPKANACRWRMPFTQASARTATEKMCISTRGTTSTIRTPDAIFSPMWSRARSPQINFLSSPEKYGIILSWPKKINANYLLLCARSAKARITSATGIKSTRRKN